MVNFNLDVAYLIAGFCVLFACVSAYLIYQYVQDEKKEVQKMKLKRDMNLYELNDFDIEEARKNKPKDEKGATFDEDEEYEDYWEGDDGAWDEEAPPYGWHGGDDGGVAMGVAGGAVVAGAAQRGRGGVRGRGQGRGGRQGRGRGRGGSVAGGVAGGGAGGPDVVQNGAAVCAAGNAGRGRGWTGRAGRGGGSGWAGEAGGGNGGGWAGGAGKVAAAGIAGGVVAGAVMAKGRRLPGRLAKMLPPEAIEAEPKVAVAQEEQNGVAPVAAAALGGAAVGGVAAGGETLSSRDAKRKEDKKRLIEALYEDLDEELLMESPRYRPKITTSSAMFLAQASKEGVVNLSLDGPSDEKPKKKKKKPLAKLLAPVPQTDDFNKYEGSKSSSPPAKAQYTIPTPVLRNDRDKIQTDYLNRRAPPPRATMNSGMDF